MAQSAIPASASQRNRSLDLLRCLAIILVLGRHLPLPLSDAPVYLRPFLSVWQRGGWIGVDLFFVLSGFLIAGLLFLDHQLHRRIDLRTFYLRRSLKIYPAFFFCLGCTFLIYPLLGIPFPTRMKVLSEAFFVQCYIPATMWHTWSLAVEEHFYVLLPLVLVWMARGRAGERDPFRGIGVGYLIVATLLLGLRISVAWQIRSFDPYRHLFPTHLRMDSLLLGVVLAWAYHYHRVRLEQSVRRWRSLLLAVGVILLSPAFLWPVESTPVLYTVGLTSFALGSAAILLGMLCITLPENFFVRVLNGLGCHSYSIYLWHIPVLFWGPGLLKSFLGIELGYLGTILVYLGGSLVLGWGMARLVELPVLHLRDWLVPSRSHMPSAEGNAPDSSLRPSPVAA